MAEISIQQKKSRGWLWVLGLVALLLLAWGASELFETHTDAPPPVAPLGSPVAAVPAPLTDVLAIVTVPDRFPLVGRSVQLMNAPVQSVVGDETFWLGASDSTRLFVALDPIPATGAHEESRAKIEAGQNISVTGVVRRVPDDLSTMRTRWNLDDRTVAALKTAQVYLAANQVTVTGR